jgi:hypothetical protein
MDMDAAKSRGHRLCDFVREELAQPFVLDEGMDYERTFRNCISTYFDGQLRSGLRSARRYG